MPTPLWFSSIIWCVMENKGYKQVADLPSMKGLAQHGALLAEYRGNTHPSGPNYRLMVAGKTFSPQEVYQHAERNVAGDYAGQGIPTVNWQIKNQPALKHNPYAELQPGVTTWKKPFDPDLLPANCQVYLALDPISNGHDPVVNTGAAIRQIDRTLTEIVAKLDHSKWFNTPDRHGRYPVFLVTFDESFLGDDLVYTAMYGKGVKAGFVSRKRYDHLSLCRTLTDNWHLAPIGEATKAHPIDDVWAAVKTSLRFGWPAAMAQAN